MSNAQIDTMRQDLYAVGTTATTPEWNEAEVAESLDMSSLETDGEFSL